MRVLGIFLESQILKDLIAFFKDYISQTNLYQAIIEVAFILFMIVVLLVFLLKYTNKKWLLLSFSFFVVLLATAVIFDLRLLYTSYKYILFTYLVLWIAYYVPSIRSFFDNLTKPKPTKSIVNDEEALDELIEELSKACASLSQRRIGAIISIEKFDSLNSYIEKGTIIDAEVTAALIETIFLPGTALHDGALLIRENRIIAAGVFYPTSKSTDIDRSLGSRHRAALGISEVTDAFTIVVSEETGNISVTMEGTITKIGAIDGLKLLIKQNLTNK